MLHGASHVDAVCRLRPQLAQPQLVEFAIFFHDIVYDAASKDNEEISAQLFEE